MGLSQSSVILGELPSENITVDTRVVGCQKAAAPHAQIKLANVTCKSLAYLSARVAIS